MSNVRYYGFFNVRSIQGEVSIQVTHGSRDVGFATEATAKKKLAADIKHYDEQAVQRSAEGYKSAVACAIGVESFATKDEMFKRLREMNKNLRW